LGAGIAETTDAGAETALTPETGADTSMTTETGTEPTTAGALDTTATVADVDTTSSPAADMEATGSPAAGMEATGSPAAGVGAANTPATDADAAATIEAAGPQPTPATAGTAAAVASAAATTPEAGAETGSDLLETAQADERFSTFVSAIQAAGLEDVLKEAGPYTIFAPTDDAFAELPAGTLDALLADPATLEKVLTYHVAQGKMNSTDVASESSVTTVEGSAITVTATGSEVQLNNDAMVISPDIETSNGVIHVIDKVLLPPDVTLP
jgi:uncharacterized surface protein with fasciclin (FAS1) repeats